MNKYKIQLQGYYETEVEAESIEDAREAALSMCYQKEDIDSESTWYVSFVSEAEEE